MLMMPICEPLMRRFLKTIGGGLVQNDAGQNEHFYHGIESDADIHSGRGCMSSAEFSNIIATVTNILIGSL